MQRCMNPECFKPCTRVPRSTLCLSCFEAKYGPLPGEGRYSKRSVKPTAVVSSRPTGLTAAIMQAVRNQDGLTARQIYFRVMEQIGQVKSDRVSTTLQKLKKRGLIKSVPPTQGQLPHYYTAEAFDRLFSKRGAA